MARQQFNVSLPEDVIRRVKHAAIDEDVSLSQYVENALLDYARPVDKRRGGGRPDNQLTMMPIVYSSDVDKLSAFFERLGGQPRLRKHRDGWIELILGRALIAMHRAAPEFKPEEVELTLVYAGKLETLRDELKEHVEISDIRDVEYGRFMIATAPTGFRIQITELDHELYS
jgi:hypothetical protein